MYVGWIESLFLTHVLSSFRTFLFSGGLFRVACSRLVAEISHGRGSSACCFFEGNKWCDGLGLL
jgi:hypothetical protein